MITPFRQVTAFLALALRVLIVTIMFGGPVYGINGLRLENTIQTSSGAGFVLLSALQRARG